MATQIFTTADVAARRGCHTVSVIRAAQALGLSRTGRDWIFTAEQAETIAGMVRDGVGNPNFGRKQKKKATMKTG